MAADALAACGTTKRWVEEAQRALRRLQSSGCPQASRATAMTGCSAPSRYEAGEAVSAAAMARIRQQITKLRS